MPRFIPSDSRPAASIADGVYVVKVSSAKVKTAQTGAEQLFMRLRLPDQQEISATLTFCAAALPVISAFCRSAELTFEPGKEVDLTPDDVLGRYIYVVIRNDTGDLESDPEPRVVRFLTQQQALAKNPALGSIKLQPQPERVLRRQTETPQEL